MSLHASLNEKNWSNYAHSRRRVKREKDRVELLLSLRWWRFISNETKNASNQIQSNGTKMRRENNRRRQIDAHVVVAVCFVTNISFYPTRLICPTQFEFPNILRIYLNFRRRSAASNIHSIYRLYTSAHKQTYTHSHAHTHTFGISGKLKTSKRKPSCFILILLISFLLSLWIPLIRSLSLFHSIHIHPLTPHFNFNWFYSQLMNAQVKFNIYVWLFSCLLLCVCECVCLYMR